MKMITDIKRLVRRSEFTVAAVLMATLAAAGLAKAQYKPTGEDGITASPKVRVQLDERRALSAPPVAALPTMSCPKCNNTWVTQANTHPKGSGTRTLMGATAEVTARHLCDGCATDWSVAGTGKGTHAVASHKCSACGAEDLACCSPKSSGAVTTKGTEQKFRVAPLN